MKNMFVLLSFFVGTMLFSQVGIGTTTPSNASMLEVSSSATGNSPYKGFMPPRVPAHANLLDIPAGLDDVGLIVFVAETGTLEIWNGLGWEEIYSLTTTITNIASQDFDSNLTWNYTNTPAFYYDYLLDDVWGVISTFTDNADNNIDNVNGHFLGCRDLDNPTGGGDVDHVISFQNVSVTGMNNARVVFDYDIYEFDNGDDVSYIVYYEDVAQPTVLLMDGSANSSAQGTEIIVVPPGTNNVRLDLILNQDGNGDYAGFDNFKVYSL
ncbi:hypothetical protein [Patiriisocius sp. Uisw_017]|uniref:hypothetical protein n=1 Tax=Patiriisocius sp. Uisw_017 TaxID=3230968 RepID=UPI0039EA812A